MDSSHESNHLDLFLVLALGFFKSSVLDLDVEDGTSFWLLGFDI